MFNLRHRVFRFDTQRRSARQRKIASSDGRRLWLAGLYHQWRCNLIPLLKTVESSSGFATLFDACPYTKLAHGLRVEGFCFSRGLLIVLGHVPTKSHPNRTRDPETLAAEFAEITWLHPRRRRQSARARIVAND